MSKQIDNLMELARDLYHIRKEIDQYEEAFKEMQDERKARKEALQEKLLASFHKVGITSIKVPEGDTVTLAKRKGIEIFSEAHALEWARNNRCVNIDRRLMAQKLKDATSEQMQLVGMRMIENEYISVRAPKPAKKGEVGAESDE